MSTVFGLDLGGTRVKALALDDSGTVLAEEWVPTNDDGAGSAWMEAPRDAVRRLEAAIGRPADRIGLAAPGLAAPEGDRIASMPGRLRGIEDFRWQAWLNAPRPVPVVNDAHAALLGEVWCGAARGETNVFMLTLGTGVGGAAMVDGRLLRGHLGRAGHLGHISLNPDGPLDIAKTPGSLEDAIGNASISTRSGGRFGTTLALLDAVRAGDGTAREIWQRSVVALAAGVTSLINVLDPRVVIIGGGIAVAGDLLFNPLRHQLNRMEWRPGGHAVEIRPAALGPRAGAMGAAKAALDQPDFTPNLD
jgi:glucokinase